MTVNISATFKKDDREYNGLIGMEKLLVDAALKGEPRRITVVSVLETSKCTLDVRDGSWTPTLRVALVEVMEGADQSTARAMLNAKFRARTGRPDDPQDTLFDVEDTPTADTGRVA